MAPRTKAQQIDQQEQLIEDAVTTTTTSVTDVLMTSMTVTPAAGVYEIFFQGSVDHGSGGASIFTSIYLDGVQEASSEREFRRGGAQGDVAASFNGMARVTVDGTQAIEGRWRTTAGTATAFERQLRIKRIG